MSFIAFTISGHHSLLCTDHSPLHAPGLFELMHGDMSARHREPARPQAFGSGTAPGCTAPKLERERLQPDRLRAGRTERLRTTMRMARVNTDDGDEGRRSMKKTVTFRFDPLLLERARATAQADNRTLTNFVETVLKNAVDRAGDFREDAGTPIQIVQGK